MPYPKGGRIVPGTPRSFSEAELTDMLMRIQKLSPRGNAPTFQSRLADWGITPDEWCKLCEDYDLADKIVDNSIYMYLLPRLPTIINTLAKEASRQSKSQAAYVKLVLRVLAVYSQRMKPLELEQKGSVDITIRSLPEEELDRQLEAIQIETSEKKKSQDGVEGGKKETIYSMKAPGEESGKTTDDGGPDQEAEGESSSEADEA